MAAIRFWRREPRLLRIFFFFFFFFFFLGFSGEVVSGEARNNKSLSRSPHAESLERRRRNRGIIDGFPCDPTASKASLRPIETKRRASLG